MVGYGYTVTPVRKAEGPGSKANCFVELVRRHYRVIPKVKTDKETEREKWLIQNCLLYNRWFLLPAAFLIQFSCGSLYAWSVFNKPIDELMGTQNVAPIAFYVTAGTFGSAAGLAGPWLERKGPRFLCLTGVTLVFIGKVITALGLHFRIMSLVLIGYGGFVGLGFGSCSITPVATLQKWFPDMRGVGGGLATCGFGVGSVVFAKIQIPLIDAVGLPLTFMTLGVIFVVLMVPSALILRTPPNNYNPGETTTNILVTESTPEFWMASDGNNGKSYNDSSITVISSNNAHTPVRNSATIIENIIENRIVPFTEVMTSTDFRLILIMWIGNITFGFTIAARLANLIIDIFGKSPSVASTVVSVNGGVNFIGRLFCPILSDYFGRKNFFIFMLSTQVIVLGLFSTMTNGQLFEMFWIALSLSTITYGGAFGVIPGLMADKFGPANVGACYGMCVACWAATGVLGGLIFTAIFDSLVKSGYATTDAILYNVNAWWLLGIACTGWIVAFFVKPTEQDVRFRKNVGKYISRVVRLG